MITLDIFSPHQPNIGDPKPTYKRTILVKSVEEKDDSVILTFFTKGQCDSLVNFTDTVKKKLKIDGQYIIHVADKWYTTALIGRTNDDKIVLMHVVPGGKFVGGKIEEI